MRPLTILLCLVFAAPAFSEGTAKKSLDAYLAEAKLVPDMLKDSVLSNFTALHRAVTPDDPKSEAPLLNAMAKAKQAQDVFLPWRNNPAKAKAEYDKNAAAFERKWESISNTIDSAKLRQLRADAGIDVEEDTESWYDDYLNYLACKANPAACSSR